MRLWFSLLFVVGLIFCGPFVQNTGSCKPEDKANNTCGPTRHCVKRGSDTFICACKSGYRKQGNTCEDVNECQGKGFRLRCKNKGAKCKNLPGSYECSCPQGFQMDSLSHRCEDIDECDKEFCHEMASCENTKGSYKCSCKTGFAGDGHECVEDLALKHKKTVQLAIMAGGAGGGALLLLITVVTFCCCARKGRKKGTGVEKIESTLSEYGHDWESSDSDSEDDESAESD